MESAVREFDGHIVYGYDMSEAVEKGILPNAQYVSALFDLPQVRRALYDSISFDNLNKLKADKVDKLFGRLDIAIKNYSTIQQVLQHHLANVGNRKGIVFTDSIKNIPRAVNIIQSAFITEPVYYIHSDMKQSEIVQTIDIFKELKHGYIVAVDMFNEGVHIDGVNTIIMLRKTKSPGVYKQQIGRALSSSSPNELVYIFDFVGNASEIIDYYNSKSREIILDLDADTQDDGGESRTKNPRISNQIIVDDSTKEIISIIDCIRKSSTFYTDDELTAIFEQCNSYEEAMQMTGLSYVWLTQKANKLGFTEKLGCFIRYKYNKKDLIPILERCNTVNEVMEELGLSKDQRHSIYYAIKALGFKDKFIGPNIRHSDFSVSVVLEMANDPKNNYTVNDIAKRLGIGKQSAYHLAKRLNVFDKFRQKKRIGANKEEIIEICKTAKDKQEAMQKIQELFPNVSDQMITGYFNKYSSSGIAKREQLEKLDDLIRKYYRTNGAMYIHDTFTPDVSLTTIRDRANRLNIRHKKLLRNFDEYRDLIEKYYPLYGTDIVGLFNLPLPRKGLREYAHKIGVRKKRSDITRICKVRNPKIIQVVKENQSLTIKEIQTKIKEVLEVSVSIPSIISIKKNIKQEEKETQ